MKTRLPQWTVADRRGRPAWTAMAASPRHRRIALFPPPLRRALMPALLSGLLLAGCAQTDPETNVTPSPSGESIPGSPPPPLPSSLPATPGKEEVSVTGTVEVVDIEGGCTVLRAGSNKTYEIKDGDPALLTAGSRVTIRGRIRSDIATICQMGPVLEVSSIQPA